MHIQIRSVVPFASPALRIRARVRGRVRVKIRVRIIPHTFFVLIFIVIDANDKWVLKSRLFFKKSLDCGVDPLKSSFISGVGTTKFDNFTTFPPLQHKLKIPDVFLYEEIK